MAAVPDVADEGCQTKVSGLNLVTFVVINFGRDVTLANLSLRYRFRGKPGQNDLRKLTQ